MTIASIRSSMYRVPTPAEGSPPVQPAVTFNDLVDALVPISHLPLEDTSDRYSVGTYTEFGTQETGLPQIESKSASGAASRGFDHLTTYGVLGHTAAYDTAAGSIGLLIQPDNVSVKQQLVSRGAGLPGSMSFETTVGGGLKAVRNNSSGTGITVTSPGGELTAGTPMLVFVTWGPNGLRIWALDSPASLGLLGTNPETAWSTITDTSDFGIGAYLNPLVDLYDGVMGHLMYFDRELTVEEMRTLALPQAVVSLADFDAGQVTASATKLVDFAPLAHPEQGFTITVVDPGSAGTASAAGEDASYAADGTPTTDDTFTAYITFDGTDSRTATFTIDVVAAPDITYTVPVAPAAAAGGEIYASHLGNDTTGAGTIGNPYKTLAKCLSVVSNDGTIILRAGDFRTEQNLTVSATNVTVKGYEPDIATDPLDPENWPRIDGSFTGVTWELYDASRNEYRTTSTGHGTGTPQAHAFVGTDPYQIPRYEPLGGRRVPTQVYRLYPYFSAAGSRGLTSFRATAAPTGPQDWSTYHGPGVMRAADGRIHITLRPVPTSYIGAADTIDPDPFVSSYNPANHTIYLHQLGKTLFSSIAAGFKFEGIMVRGYDKFFWGTQSNVTIQRNVLWGADYYFGLFQLQNASTNWLFDHNIFEIGYTDWTPYQLVKQNLLGGFGYGQIVPVWTNGNVAYVGFKFTNNLMPSGWATVYAPNANSGTDVEFGYNAVRTRDDFDIWPVGVGKRHEHHNFIEGPTHGWGTAVAPPSTLQVYIHHNVVVNNRMTLEFIGDRRGHGTINKHNTANGMVVFEYHNTYIGNQRDVYLTGLNASRPLAGGYTNTSSTPHRSFNNIFIAYVQVSPTEGQPATHYLFHDFAPNDANRKWFANGDGYWSVLGAGVTGSKELFKCWSAARGTGSEVSYATLAAWRASTPYSNTLTTGWAFGSKHFEEDAIEADPLFANSSAITQDARFDTPASDYVATAAAYLTGAVNITTFGWPGATIYEAHRGALGPSDDGSSIGPQPVQE